ncbi:hypothetical protein D9757_015251 [Collybiopsis confluens]|uniref:Xylanolytic transcriptional activator regulatory domain-containing protein n=1 Tax=Collybiopsis confluens TaxID=2823264 RepID=A0A8H5FPP8_9AGAR|nr:hypothetical protein D9757_015251 [Collybiopsis confluens]
MVGIGIRLAQDVGAHRRKPNQTLTVEDELWKRAFWCLVCMDRVFSTALGRPCAIQEEDYDVEMPTECDDEYWEHRDPSQAFRQPPGRPSIISSFNAYIKLNLLLSIALRTIYAINKSKILLGFGGDQWEYHIVAELDSALNQWVDSVPDHLRWDPKRENNLWFNQSVNLYTQYYLVQILVHRPFISSPKKPSPLSFPSLAICTNAARSASHVMDVQRRRGGMLMPFAHITAFTAGIVLLLNIWGGKRSGLSTDTNKEMADVYKCMQVLKACENRWHSAGRIWYATFISGLEEILTPVPRDILYELASVGELPLPGGSPSASNKRERDADSPIPTWEGGSIPLESRTIAGSRRVSANTPLNSDMFKPSPSTSSPVPMGTLGLGENSPSPSNPYTPPDGMQLFSLPVYSDELGRLPLHGQVKFSTVAPHLNSNPVQPQVMEWYGQPSQPPQPRPTQSAGEGLIGGLGGMGTEFMQSTFYDYSPFTGSTLGVVGPSSSAGSLNAPAPAYRSRFTPPSAEGRHPGTHAPTTHGQGRSFDPSGVGGGYMSSTGQTSHDSSIGAPMSGGLPLSLDNDTFAMWSNTPSGFE